MLAKDLLLKNLITFFLPEYFKLSIYFYSNIVMLLGWYWHGTKKIVHKYKNKKNKQNYDACSKPISLTGFFSHIFHQHARNIRATFLPHIISPTLSLSLSCSSLALRSAYNHCHQCCSHDIEILWCVHQDWMGKVVGRWARKVLPRSVLGG